MIIGEEIRLFDWFVIHFTENKGMAFEWSLEASGEKVFTQHLSNISHWWHRLVLTQPCKTNTKTTVVMSIALILAGAIGNMIDSAFYGMIFSHSFGQTATFMQGGYAGFLQGSVVDMFYFPIINSHFPDWLPFWGGDHFIFFRHIFNIADSAISIGVINLLLFHRSFFK